MGEVSTQKGDSNTLTEREKGSSSTLSSSKKEWAVHLGIVKSSFWTDIPKKWIQEHKFCYHLLADRVLQPYLKQIDPNILPVINIAPGLSKEEFVDIAYTKYMTPLLNHEWGRHKMQSAMENMYFSE